MSDVTGSCLLCGGLFEFKENEVMVCTKKCAQGYISILLDVIKRRESVMEAKLIASYELQDKLALALGKAADTFSDTGLAMRVLGHSVMALAMFIAEEGCHSALAAYEQGKQQSKHGTGKGEGNE